MYANYSQFKSEETDEQKLVESRMLLWCMGGESVVIINGHSFNMNVGDCIITPWEFKIKIKVNGDIPFNVAAIHIIPNMKKGALKNFKLGGATSPQEHYKYREDFDISNFDKEFIEFKISPNNSLSYLIHHIIAWFSDQKKDIKTAEFLAHHLISTNLRIYEIASQAQFNCPFYFSKIFKKEFGLSPL